MCGVGLNPHAGHLLVGSDVIESAITVSLT